MIKRNVILFFFSFSRIIEWCRIVFFSVLSFHSYFHNEFLCFSFWFFFTLLFWIFKFMRKRSHFFLIKIHIHEPNDEILVFLGLFRFIFFSLFTNYKMMMMMMMFKHHNNMLNANSPFIPMDDDDDVLWWWVRKPYCSPSHCRFLYDFPIYFFSATKKKIFCEIRCQSTENPKN